MGRSDASDILQHASGRAGHDTRRERLVRDLQAARGTPVRLAKDTSNLFRSRLAEPARQLDVRDFNHVIEVNPAAGWVDVEGMVTYDALSRATLAEGVMPLVVPQLKSITIGGAVTGIGIESSSFRHGLPHESVLEMDILTGNGDVLTARPDNDCRDLFYGFANSYGTLGYAIRLRVRTMPVKPFVDLEHRKFAEPAECFAALQAACNDATVDFVDASVFGKREMVITLGRFVDQPTSTPSDYTWLKMYFRSQRERTRDCLSIYDYLWRWDTDWFWCSKHVFAQNPLVRLLAGRKRLNSITYQKIMRWNNRTGVMRRVNRIRGIHTESVIQDVDIPIENAPAFLDFFHREIGIKPVWMCPTRPRDPDVQFEFFPMRPNQLYVNFGFWDVVKTREPKPPGHFNRKIETRVRELGGIKSLYADSYYTEDEFWDIFDRETYRRLKSRYDSNNQLKDLYAKTVLRA